MQQDCSQVPPALGAVPDCGRLHGGFARIRCPTCHAEQLLAFSVAVEELVLHARPSDRRSLPSGSSKRRCSTWPHAQVVFTIPKALRGLIERERKLHGLMARAAWETLREMLSAAACEPTGVPSVVASL